MERDKAGHVVHKFDVFMMATIAYYAGEDLSRSLPGLCRVYAQDQKHFYGQWVELSQLFDVVFPKDTTRPLRTHERAYFSALQPEMLMLSTDKNILDVSLERIPSLTAH